MTTSTPRLRSAALALGACLTVGATGSTVPVSAHAAHAAPSAVRELDARLRPSGDPNGSGRAHFALNKARQRVCADVTWRHIQTPDAAHIHRQSDGGIVVDLTGSVTGGRECATGVGSALIARILQHPRRYYFNVHNPTYPAGALQGTLHR